MYKVKNITRGKLLLFDIGVKLNAGQVLDLDAILPREKIESSANLKIAINDELIAVLHRDVTQPTTSLAFDPALLLQMEQRIRESIEKQYQAPQPKQEEKTDSEVQRLTTQLSELTKMLANGANVSASVPEMDESDMDVDTLRKVHEKTLARMTKGSSGEVKIKEGKSKSEVGLRAEELEDFLK